MDRQNVLDVSPEPQSEGFYASLYEEGFGSIDRFFSGRKNSLCAHDDTMDPRELLALLLRHPEQEQHGGLSFTEFQKFYQGVKAALEKLNQNNYDRVPKNKRPLIDELARSCEYTLRTISYEDLLVQTRNGQWPICMATLTDLLANCAVIQTIQPDQSLNHQKVLNSIDQEDASAIYGVIRNLNAALDTGNIAATDIEWLLDISPKLFALPLESFTVTEMQELRAFSTKVNALKQSPGALYLSTHEASFFQNDPLLAANNFVECLRATQALAEGKNITPEVIAGFSDFTSFLAGINAGLAHHHETLGRIYSLKKLVAFIERLPQELELLRKNDHDTSKHDITMTKALVYSPELIEQLNRIVREIRQLDPSLLCMQHVK